MPKDAKSNCKRFWQYVKSKTTIKSGIGDLVYTNEDGSERLTRNDQEKAEVLSDYFKTVFTDESSKPPPVDEKCYESILSSIDITEAMILNKLSDLNISKSPGPDGLHPRVLKELRVSLLKPLQIIFSCSIRNGKLPDEWKEAKISAIFKKGSRKLPCNHRPVSLTCILCKVLESIIRDYVITHFKSNRLFSKKQFGFINGRSTSLQLLNVLEEWFEILDSGGVVETSDLNAMVAWSDRWLLKFHPDKCKVLTVGNNGGGNKYYIQDHELAPTDKEKDLGVVIDKELKFEHHIQDKVNKANSIMALVRRSFTYLDEEMFKLIFKGIVRPHLEYATQIWRPHKVKDITSIENVQRRATKLIPSLNHLSYEERLRKLNLPSLEYRRLRGVMIEVYKQFNIYDSDVSLKLKLAPTTANETTRGHSKKLFKRRAVKSIGRHSFTHRVVTPWNSLTEEIVSACSVKSFEAKLDKHWKNEELVFNYRADPPGTRRPQQVESNREAEA
eukprot:gene14125-15603_t